MHTPRQKIRYSIKQRVSAIAFTLVLLTVTAVSSEAMTKRNTMQQETEISYKLAGKLYEVKSGNLCFADISSKAVGLLETSNDTYDMLLNAQQIAELKSEKDWVEIHFCDVKNLRIGYLKQNSAVGTILIFFKNAKPFYIVWSGEEFSPTLANIAANTIADKSLHDIMTKCTK